MPSCLRCRPKVELSASFGITPLSSTAGLRLSLVALVISVLCFAVQLAVYAFHVALPIEPRVVTFIGVFGMTWPLWAYAVAVYRRSIAKQG